MVMDSIPLGSPGYIHRTESDDCDGRVMDCDGWNPYQGAIWPRRFRIAIPNIDSSRLLLQHLVQLATAESFQVQGDIDKAKALKGGGEF